MDQTCRSERSCAGCALVSGSMMDDAALAAWALGEGRPLRIRNASGRNDRARYSGQERAVGPNVAFTASPRNGMIDEGA